MNAKKISLFLLFVFCMNIVNGCTPGSISDAQSNGTGYCPPGTLKLISGQWYSCGGGEWMLMQDTELHTFSNQEVEVNLSRGKVANFFAVGTVLAIDPIPGDEVGYFLIGGTVMLVVFSEATMPQANFIGTDIESFKRWHQGSSVAIDVAVTNAYIDPKLGNLTFRSDTPLTLRAPNGTTAIVIEDDFFSALLLGNALLAAGITPVAVYTDCDSYRVGPIKTAHIIIVDNNSEFTSNKGWSCVAEMYAQVPPPLFVIAYTGGPTGSVVSNFINKGAQQVVDKFSTNQTQLVELLVSLLP